MYDLLSEAIQLAPAVAEDKEEREKLHSLMILLMGKFADKDRFKKVLEENRMILEDNVAVKALEEMGMEKAVLGMLKKGMSLTTIAECIEMPVEWVEELQRRSVLER